MSKLLINVMLFPKGYWETWPPTKRIEQCYSLILPGDAVRQAANWSQRNVAEFVRDAIGKELGEVLAAMEEREVGIS